MMLKNWCCISIVVSVTGIACKQPVSELPIVITPQDARVAEGDSVQFFVTNSVDQVTWRIVQGDGNMRGDGWYSAPLYVHNEIDTIRIQAVTANQQSEATLFVIKKAATQPSVSFSQSILPLLNSNCNFSACHGNGSRAGGVNLQQYDSVRMHLIPFSALSSRIYLSLIKTDPLRRMPPAGPLQAAKVELLTRWIDQGAKPN